MPDFNALLDADPTQFERPPLIPEGDFLGMVKSRKFDKSAQKKTPFVRFDYSLLAPMASVPAEALEGIDLAKTKPHDEFYLTEDAMFRLREFFELVDAVMPSTRESIDACVGKQVVITFGHSPSQRDPSRMYAEIRGYAKAEV